MGRAPCCTKVGLHRGPWTAREDALLVQYIQSHGEGQWRSLPKNAGLLRCGKSCRLRWMNYLRPNIKRGNITPDEEDLMIRLHGLLGNRWSLIAGRLPGRTDNEIKNYWNTHLSKRLRGQGTDPNTHKQISESKLEKSSNNRKKRGKGNSTKTKTQKINHHKKKVNKNDNNGSGERERTKIHLPKPARVTSIIPLSRSNSNASLSTNASMTSVISRQSQSQSQNESHGLLFDSDDVMLDMPWLSKNYDDGDENRFDHLTMMNVDVIRPRHDEVGPSDNAMQLQKVYEEYLQLIKADDHDDHDHGNFDDDDDDDDDDVLDSLAKSFLI